MISILTDERIHELLVEPKRIPAGLGAMYKAMSAHNGYYRKDLDVQSDSDNRFVIKIRQTCAYPMNFSVILGYMLPSSYTVFRLRRYNGKSHFHSNTLEKQPEFYDYHIHEATERYQQARGYNPDHFAEPTKRYGDLQGAIDCLVNDCGFDNPLQGTPMFPLPGNQQ
jgi:hypothetical protein